MFLFYVLSFFKKGTLFKGDIIQGGTLFKEIRCMKWIISTITRGQQLYLAKWFHIEKVFEFDLDQYFVPRPITFFWILYDTYVWSLWFLNFWQFQWVRADTISFLVSFALTILFSNIRSYFRIICNYWNEIFAKKFLELAILKISVFWVGHFGFFFQKKNLDSHENQSQIMW